jgi:hypothetical protein
MSSGEKDTKTKPQLSMLALISFIVSFVTARIFTALNPNTVLISGGFHIHHFWYGLALVATGGWLGISYQSERIDRLAAILFGSGGGLIGDEVGLLLTFGNYWTGITYTFVIIFLTSAFMLILLNKYSRIIRKEFTQFLSNTSLYFGVFLAAVSIAFLLETENIIIATISSLLAITACVIILAYFIQRTRTRR